MWLQPRLNAASPFGGSQAWAETVPAAASISSAKWNAPKTLALDTRMAASVRYCFFSAFCSLARIAKASLTTAR